MVSMNPTEAAVKRILNGVCNDTLKHIDDQRHLLKYSIDDGPNPVSADEVSNYVGVIKLRAITLVDTNFVKWSSNGESRQQHAV